MTRSSRPKCLAAIFLATLIGCSAWADEPLGLVRERPADGRRYVPTEQGYMVEYEHQIPGTEIRFTMVPIAGGTFLMGERNDGLNQPAAGNRLPPLEVPIEPFWIGRHEVTWAEFQVYYDLRIAFARFDERGIRQVTAANQADAVTAPSWIYDPPGRLPHDQQHWRQHPAVSMTQYGARQYTKWLSKLSGQFYRLPSDVEWEYACRAGSTTAYHFGDDPSRLDDYAWYFANSDEDTHPVGLKQPNAWGLYDMHGNAAEWVLDQYHNDGFDRLAAVVDAGGAPIVWPESLDPRIVRGGSWGDDAAACRSACRVGSSADWQSDEANVPRSAWWLASRLQRQIGFRIVRPLEAPPANQHSRYWDADVPALREAIKHGRGYRGLIDPP